MHGVVDIRLAMLILFGSLFGIQIGAIGTTYVKDQQGKLVMAVIMFTVLFSRFFYVPGYLGKLGMMMPLPEATGKLLKLIGDGVLALILGATIVLVSLYKGMKAHRRQHETLAEKDGMEE